MTGVKESASGRLARLLTSPQNAFLLLASFFGVVMLFLTPPALVGDEPNHFFRAYQISDGTIVGVKHEGYSGGWIPESVLVTNRRLVGDIEMHHDVKFDTNLITELRRVPLDEDNKVFVAFHNTVVYSPVAYVPQVIGIWAGKAVGASALGLIYFARFVNLLFFLALAYSAIRITPVHKWTFAFLWLTPTTVFQTASASVDAFTFGICFFGIACFLRLAFDDDVQVDWRTIAGLFAVCLLAVLSKQAYVLLPALFLIIPRAKFRSPGIYYLIFILLIFSCIAAVVWWSATVKPIFMSYRGDIETDPDRQLELILDAPLDFLKIAVASYLKLYKYYFVTFFGQLTWLDLFVPKWVTVYLFAIVTGFAVLDKGVNTRISTFDKSIFTAVIAGTALVVSVLLYLSWSPVGADRVAGIQGRYFIPVAPLFFLLLFNQKLRWGFFERRVALIFYVTVTISLAVTVYTVTRRYYL
ncbi:MAG TPA: DUF2142 domain-containing protein [Pyrinomonadaceae bacterium]|nr:DUF2142 domain-containing protein [Pyrinomonadaceae bacterium]